MPKEKLLKIGLLLGDVAAMELALFLALWLRDITLPNRFGFFSYHFSIMYAMWIFILFVLDVYDIYFFTKPLDFFFNVVIFSVAAFFTSVTYFYFAPLDYSAPKTILLLNIAVFAILFFAWRAIAGSFLHLHRSEGAYEDIHKKISLSSINEEWFLQNVAAPNRVGDAVKRLVDVASAIVGLLLFFALFPFIALLIVMDSPGGILYSQKRTGKNGNIFVIHKFRSMTPESANNTITKTGAVLRRLHLDELPQAWSMLKGDISFVGPRPEWIELAKTFEREIPFYRHRYSVKPGIIGWAQINFPPSRSLDEVKEKFEYDLYYIKNRSLLLDFEIMLKAVKLFFW